MLQGNAAETRNRVASLRHLRDSEILTRWKERKHGKIKGEKKKESRKREREREREKERRKKKKEGMKKRAGRREEE
jgi:hypothetical protein